MARSLSELPARHSLVIFISSSAVNEINYSTVQLDTGSSDFFIPGVNCDSTCDGHKRYDPSLSSTVKYVGGPVNLGYGGSAASSSASVKQYRDTVTFSGYTVCVVSFGCAEVTDDSIIRLLNRCLAQL
jgi:Eukaryotic aspartyl protease